MPTYAFRDEKGELYLSAPEFAMPIPVHAQTPEALDAVESVRRLGHARRIEAVVSSLVTEHGQPPPIEPYDGPIPAGAKRLLALAESKGWKAHLFETAGRERAVVEGVLQRRAFRAVWKHGRAESGTWHEQSFRYAYVDDPRPEPVQDPRTKLSKAKHRPVGVGKIHLAIVGSPVGMSVGVTGVERRVKEDEGIDR